MLQLQLLDLTRTEEELVPVEVAGRSERVLPGLGTHDAGEILKALKAFGADVNG